MAESTRMLSLVRVILWLKKTDWGLSFLLAVASLVVIIAIVNQQPDGPVEPLFAGRVFRAGFHLGTIIFPNYMTRGTNGFYLVPLFGVGADFLVLMAFWFIVVRFAHRLRAKEQDSEIQPS